MPEYDLVPLDDATRWRKALAHCTEHDTYHLHGYHVLAAKNNEGTPVLFTYSERDRHVYFPMVLRRIDNYENAKQETWSDATSVYGYAGPLTSFADADPAFASRFQLAFREVMHGCRVVSLFSRLHPMIDSTWLCGGIAEIGEHGPTIWIDLAQSEEDYLASVSQEHRRHLRAGYRQNFVMVEDERLEHLNSFRDLYEDTMRRNNAASYYFFPDGFYEILRNEMRHVSRLFLVVHEEKVISAALIFVSGKYVQYHLSGTARDYLKLNCSRFLLDGVRKWAKDQGYKWMNLGGGVGARSDSLLRFKSGFSPIRRTFKTMRMVINPEAYTELLNARMQMQSLNFEASYFPEYRAPIVENTSR